MVLCACDSSGLNGRAIEARTYWHRPRQFLPLRQRMNRDGDDLAEREDCSPHGHAKTKQKPDTDNVQRRYFLGFSSGAIFHGTPFVILRTA